MYCLDKNARVAGVNKSNVEDVGRILVKIAETHGMIDPNVVVQEAQDVSSPLHPVFEWDDTAAAHEHRIWQARNLIKSVRIVTEKGEESIERRVFVNVITSNARGYMAVPTVMKDQVLREQVLNKAKHDLQCWRERYAELKELSGFFMAVDTFLEGSQEQPLSV